MFDMQIPSLVVLIAAATTSLARTPDGFSPGSKTDLFVSYGGVAALNGAVVAQGGAFLADWIFCDVSAVMLTSALAAATNSIPSVGTTMQLAGTSYALIMVRSCWRMRLIRCAC